MQRLVKIFSENTLFEVQSAKFKQWLYIYLILRVTFWLNQYNLFFGENALVYSSFRSMGNYKDIAFILMNSHSSTLAYYFLFGLLLLCALSLFVRAARPVADILIWLLVINLHYKIYASLTGGDYLINQLLFFNVGIGLYSFKVPEKLNFITKILHNGAVIAIITQVCLLYFLSGLAKLIDFNWQSGNALEIISAVEQFKLIETPHQSAISKALLLILNYLILTYQVLFPVLVFNQRIKKIVLIFGIGMHLYIIAFMGLFWFGTIMIMTYVFFWPLKSTTK